MDDKTRRAKLQEEGERRYRELLGRTPMLNNHKAVLLLNLRPGEVRDLREAGHLFAVRVPGEGYRFPAWQFTKAGIVDGLDKVLAALAPELPDSMRLQFLQAPSPALDGFSPVAVLLSGHVDDVVALARTVGNQGEP